MNVILAGLIGSIITVFITKIIDLIQKSKEHKYSLQKAFFERKLKSAEAAVSQWYVTAGAIGALAKLYENAPILEEGLEPEVFEAMNTTFSTQLKKVQELSDNLAHSFVLYFDVDESFWEDESMKNYFTKLSSVTALAKSLNLLYELQPKIEGTKYEGFVKNKIKELNHQIRPDLKELSSIMEDARVNIIKLLRKVRNEMKKYEAQI